MMRAVHCALMLVSNDRQLAVSGGTMATQL